jgi:DNA polymerase III alpha subunit
MFNPDFSSLTFDCPKTWQLIGDGNTKGVFQLESQLGRHTAKKLKPENIEQLSGLLSILRPGCLEGYDQGKSMTDHYIDRKNGLEAVEYFHPSLEPILKDTYGIMIYQEQSMRIASDIAGFNLQDSDTLRSAVGKKKTDLMAKLKGQFIKGCIKTKIVNKEQAEQLFEWIEKSQRYNFNKSHATAYAYNSYLTAYCKANYPLQFFCSYLQYAKDKQHKFQEINELVANAKLMDIDIYGPNLAKTNDSFSIINDRIYFGLTNIKNLGLKVYNKLKDIIDNTKEILNISNQDRVSIEDWTWTDFLIFISRKVNSKGVESLIQSGALDYYGIGRATMSHELSLFLELKEREQQWMQNKLLELREEQPTLIDLLGHLIDAPTGKSGGIYHKKRIPIVQSLLSIVKKPLSSTQDTVDDISDNEKNLLGISLTCTKVDDKDISDTNCTCKDIAKGYYPNKFLLPVEIESVREWTIKSGDNKGKTMGYLNVLDSTCSLDSIPIFTSIYLNTIDILYEGNTVLLYGKKTKNGFFIENISQLDV